MKEKLLGAEHPDTAASEMTIKTNVKAGYKIGNHNETLAVRSDVKAGVLPDGSDATLPVDHCGHFPSPRAAAPSKTAAARSERPLS